MHHAGLTGLISTLQNIAALFATLVEILFEDIYLATLPLQGLNARGLRWTEVQPNKTSIQSIHDGGDFDVKI